MDSVVVSKEELLKVVQTNRDAHQQLYKDALEGFFVESQKKLNKAIKKLAAGELISSISLTIPTDHTSEYDKVISMLKMSVEEEIELRSHEYDMYVLDSWISASEKSLLNNYALSSSNSALYA